MIRYAITKDQLEAAVDKEKPKWRSRAKWRQAKINAAKKYDEKTDIWSEIKDVYRRLQNQKCAYCERQLAGDRYGSIEHDVEHFRPKNATTEWSHDKVEKTWHKRGRSDGYYWLAYDLFNYVTSCKPCNTMLKGNGFPIALTGGKECDTIDELNKMERPLLIYPLSDKDADPETLIHFRGIAAVSINADVACHEHRRASVTIAFFDLNGRDELQRDRARVIKLVWDALEKRDNPQSSPNERRAAQEDLDTYVHSGHEHANCARSFVRMYKTNLEEAVKIRQIAREMYDKLVRGAQP